MKSIVDIRIFAIEQAVAILGAGTADKEIVKKAEEIESYIIKGQDFENQKSDNILAELTDLIIMAISSINQSKEDIDASEEKKGFKASKKGNS